MSHAETLDRALRLLARARRVLDDVTGDPADLAPVLRKRTEKTADEIAALIGHPVTDQDEAPELYELRDFLDELADPEGAVTTVPRPMACDGCGDRMPSATVCVSPSGVHTPRPLPEPDGNDLQTAHPAMAVPDACDGSMVHYFGSPDRPVAQRFDAAGHPPNCPAYTGPRCSFCGAPDGFGHYAGCGDPDRPDPLGLRRNAKAVHAPTREVGKSSEPATRTDTQGSAAAGPCLACTRVDGHAYCGGNFDGPCANRSQAGRSWPEEEIRTALPAGGVYPCEVDRGSAHLRGPCACKSREPAAPVEETPASRARRLDRERDEAGSAYRAATQTADAAWRAIGGRP